MRSRLLTVLWIGLAACSAGDPKAPNDANFEAALDEHYAGRPECVRVGKEADETGIVADLGPSGFARERDVARLDALVQFGLLEVETATVEVPNFLTGTDDTEEVSRYVLTDAGRDALRPAGQQRGFGRGASEFCYGRRDVTAITNFTEPADVMGVRATSVSYAYELVDVPQWARSAAVGSAFPEIAKAIGRAGSDSDDLVLTSAGWVHHQDAP